MTEQTSIWSRLVGARVIQTLAIYIPVGWVLTEIATAATENFGLPAWVPGLAMTLLIAGVPVVAFLSWAFQITDEGIRTQVRSLKGGIAITVAISLLLGIGATLFQRLQVKPEIEPVTEMEEAAPVMEAVRSGPPMVGVLPFTYIAAQADASFFAAGVHDDLLTQLARLSGMRVISRTSVMQYANTTTPIPEIGKALGADAILEGGIQMAGSRIRINAQLIDAETDDHLWAETYDRELTPDNLFDVQAEIARAIASALQTALTEAEARQLDIIPTSNMAAYRAFHEAMTIQNRTTFNRDGSQALLEKAIELDPTFTRAMSELTGLIALQNFTERDPAQFQIVENLVNRIGAIAPNSVDHLQAQSFYAYYAVRDYDAADRLLDLAIERSPSDTRLWNMQSWVKRRNGDLEGWIEAARQTRLLEPNDERWSGILAGRLMAMHRYDEALEVAESVDSPGPLLQHVVADLRLKDHGNFSRYRDVTERLYASLAPDDRLYRRFRVYALEARLAEKDDAGARLIIDEIENEVRQIDRRLPYLNPELQMLTIYYSLTGDQGGRLKTLDFARQLLGINAEIDPMPLESLQVRDRITLHMLAGETEQLVAALRELRSLMEEDLAEKMGASGMFCGVLAMSQMAEDAVDCLREASSRPSDVAIYMEPLLPYYHPIRDTPEFQAYLDELVEAGWISSDSDYSSNVKPSR